MPINRFAGQSFLGYDLRLVGDLAERIDAVYGDKEAAEDDPMLDFDERDLVRFAEEAGFFPIRLTLELEIRPTDAEPLDAFLDRAPNPLVPTLREAMAEALSRQEQEHVVSYLQPLVENGRGVWRMASAYLDRNAPNRLAETTVAPDRAGASGTLQQRLDALRVYSGALAQATD
jgi:arsenite methyltransferase